MRPAGLANLPAFPGAALDDARSGGDLCVQACADDPQIAVHAIRNLARIARGTASVRYSQLGFGRTSSTSTSQATPRNMMSFKDGTLNLKAEDTTATNTHVWVQPGDGTDQLGRLDAGLFFTYQRDPRTQFVTIQRSLAGKHNDALNEYIQHVGSGLFACPPGVRPGQYWGQPLFA